MRNDRVGETRLLRDALSRISELLPSSWRIDEREEVQAWDRRLDAIIELIGPNQGSVSFVVEAKRSGSVPTPLLLTALRELRRQFGRPVLFISDYIGPSLRDALAQDGISFADATGWVRIVNDDPLVLLTGQGAERSPRARQATAVTRLNGVASSRAIRALATTDLPVGVRSLAATADVSPGSISKLLATLTSEGIVDRDQDGGVLAVRRRALIRRWVRDYSFAKSNSSVGYYLAPRGLDRTLARLDACDGVTITGSAAARRMLPGSTTPVAPLRLLALYTADPPTLARDLGLVDADSATANITMARPQDAQVVASTTADGPTLASVALVLADLLTLPGRSDAEAEQLMDALASTDAAWEE